MTHFNTQILMTRENHLCLKVTRFNSSLKAKNGVGDALLKMRQEGKSVGAFINGFLGVFEFWLWDMMAGGSTKTE